MNNKKFKIYYKGIQDQTMIEYAGKEHQFKFLEGLVVDAELADYLLKNRKDFSITDEVKEMKQHN